MSLAAQAPVIDNLTFDGLVTEAQTRIARYAPEWTDFNPGDAGFALVQLFAWMTDLLIYRLGQVPTLNYIKFLQLIGIELTPAQPAEVTLLFPVQSSYTATSVQVPARTQVAAPPAASTSAPSNGSTTPIVFETESGMTAVLAAMDAVLAYDGFSYTDVSASNTPAGPGFAPFGPLAAAGSALLLGFNPPQNLPGGVQLSLGVWPALPRGVPPPQPCGGGASAVYAPAQVVWEYWAGTGWQGLTLLSDGTLALTETGLVQLKLPAAGQIAPARLGGRTDVARAWIRVRLVTSSYETAPVLTFIAANAVTAQAAQTVQNEVVGGSNGLPSQVFTLSSTPVLPGTLQLQIDEGSGFEDWTEVDDFAASGPDDTDYMLDNASGTITFGDGVYHGAIPAANPNNPNGNIVAVTYRFGGGANTNIAAGTALTLMTSLPGIDTGNLSNPFAASGGSDEEALTDAMARAPEVLQSQDRAVTCSDFELLATQAGPIARAKAMPLSNPNFPGQTVPGTVTVIVVPDVAVPAPMPSPGLLRTVCAYLDQRRLITTELYVIAPTYVPVSISVDVLAQPDADTGSLQTAVETAISTLLDPRNGGTDGKGWPFGGTIYFVWVLQAAMVPGVIRVANLTITASGTTAAACTDVPIPAGALVAVQSVTANMFTDPSALSSVA
jgi:predicted phage baseplate assembly protein